MIKSSTFPSLIDNSMFYTSSSSSCISKDPIGKKVEDASRGILMSKEASQKTLKKVDEKIAEANSIIQDIFAVLSTLKKIESFNYIRIPQKVVQFSLNRPSHSYELDIINVIQGAFLEHRNNYQNYPNSVEEFIKLATQYPRLKSITDDLRKFLFIRESIKESEGNLTAQCMNEVEKLITSNHSNIVHIVDVIFTLNEPVNITAICNLIKSKIGSPFLKGEIVLRSLSYHNISINKLLNGISADDLFENISLNVPNLIKEIARSTDGDFEFLVNILSYLFKSKDRDIVWESIFTNFISNATDHWNSSQMRKSILEKKWPVDHQTLMVLIKLIRTNSTYREYDGYLSIFTDLAKNDKLPGLSNFDKILTDWLLQEINEMPDKSRDILKHLNIIILILKQNIPITKEIGMNLNNLIFVVKGYINSKNVSLKEKYSLLLKQFTNPQESQSINTSKPVTQEKNLKNLISIVNECVTSKIVSFKEKYFSLLGGISQENTASLKASKSALQPGIPEPSSPIDEGPTYYYKDFLVDQLRSISSEKDNFSSDENYILNALKEIESLITQRKTTP